MYYNKYVKYKNKYINNTNQNVHNVKGGADNKPYMKKIVETWDKDKLKILFNQYFNSLYIYLKESNLHFVKELNIYSFYMYLFNPNQFVNDFEILKKEYDITKVDRYLQMKTEDDRDKMYSYMDTRINRPYITKKYISSSSIISSETKPCTYFLERDIDKFDIVKYYNFWIEEICSNNSIDSISETINKLNNEYINGSSPRFDEKINFFISNPECNLIGFHADYTIYNRFYILLFILFIVDTLIVRSIYSSKQMILQYDKISFSENKITKLYNYIIQNDHDIIGLCDLSDSDIHSLYSIFKDSYFIYVTLKNDQIFLESNENKMVFEKNHACGLLIKKTITSLDFIDKETYRGYSDEFKNRFHSSLYVKVTSKDGKNLNIFVGYAKSQKNQDLKFPDDCNIILGDLNTKNIKSFEIGITLSSNFNNDRKLYSEIIKNKCTFNIHRSPLQAQFSKIGYEHDIEKHVTNTIPENTTICYRDYIIFGNDILSNDILYKETKPKIYDINNTTVDIYESNKYTPIPNKVHFSDHYLVSRNLYGNTNVCLLNMAADQDSPLEFYIHDLREVYNKISDCFYDDETKIADIFGEIFKN